MGKYNILIIDDDPLIVKTLEKYLKLKDNINVFIETNSLNAYKRIEEDNIHIVLLDIQMPERNGLVLMKELKDLNPLLQVIIMSGYATPERILVAFKEGANDFIMKPFPTIEYVWEIINISIDKLNRWKENLGLLVRTD